METKEVTISVLHIEAVIARYPNLIAQRVIKELIGEGIYKLIKEG